MWNGEHISGPLTHTEIGKRGDGQTKKGVQIGMKWFPGEQRQKVKRIANWNILVDKELSFFCLNDWKLQSQIRTTAKELLNRIKWILHTKQSNKMICSQIFKQKYSFKIIYLKT